MSSKGAPCAAGGTPRKASSMRTQPAGSSCLSVRAAGPFDNPCQSSPLARMPASAHLHKKGEIPRRARALANRHRVRLRRRRNRRRPIFTLRAAFQARRRGLGRLGQALPRHLARYSLAYHALSPVPHVLSRGTPSPTHTDLLRFTPVRPPQTTQHIEVTQKLESHNRHWKSHQPKPATGNGGGSGVSIGVVVAAAGGSGRLSCAPARCQMCTDLARARVGAHAAPDLEHRSPRSCRPGSRTS